MVKTITGHLSSSRLAVNQRLVTSSVPPTCALLTFMRLACHYPGVPKGSMLGARLEPKLMKVSISTTHAVKDIGQLGAQSRATHVHCAGRREHATVFCVHCVHRTWITKQEKHSHSKCDIALTPFLPLWPGGSFDSTSLILTTIASLSAITCCRSICRVTSRLVSSSSRVLSPTSCSLRLACVHKVLQFTEMGSGQASKG